MSESGLRLLASGFYGGFNLGDEAVLSGLIRLMDEAPGKVDLTVLSGNPDWTASAYGLRSLSRSLNQDIVQRAISLMRSDALILGGGGLLQDVSGRRGMRGTLGRTLALAAWSRVWRVPVLFWGIGVGPLGASSRRQVSKALRRAQVVAVRDGASLALCRGLGATARIVPDHAWALDLPQAADEGRLGVSLRRWPGLDLGAVAQGLQAVHGPFERPALFLPMEAQDLALGRELQTMLGRDRLAVPERFPTLRELIGDLRRCRGVLAMRLHAGLLSAALGIPSVGVAYDPKVSELHRALGGVCVPVEEAQGAPSLLAAEMARRPRWREDLLAHAQGQREAARGAAREILGGLRSHG